MASRSVRSPQPVRLTVPILIRGSRFSWGCGKGLSLAGPDAAVLENPWTEETTTPPLAGDLPDDVRRLVKAVIRSAEAEADFDLNDEGCMEEQSPSVKNGWSALRGWNHVLHNNLPEALEAFRSGDIAEGDPFGIVPAISFVEHLQALRQVDISAEQSTDSSNRVWQEVFSPALPPTAGHSG